jgi:hypothetical protein
MYEVVSIIFGTCAQSRDYRRGFVVTRGFRTDVPAGRRPSHCNLILLPLASAVSSRDDLTQEAEPQNKNHISKFTLT